MKSSQHHLFSKESPMQSTSFILSAVLTVCLSSSAFADGTQTHTTTGYRGGTATKTFSSDGTSASRSINAQGALGGSASLSGSCTQGAGCSREYSRTLRNGATASGTATIQRGVGVSRSGTGFRGRKY